MPEIVLHQFEISPFCQKVAKALSHKGLSFSVVNYNGIRAIAVGRLASTGKLPVLDIDGKRIHDSTEIAVYLDSAFPDQPALFPSDPAVKAQVELWEDWSDEVMYWFEVYYRVKDEEALNLALDHAMLGRSPIERPILKAGFKMALTRGLHHQGIGRLPVEQVDKLFRQHLDRIDQTLHSNATGWLVGPNKSIADIALGTQLGEVLRTSNRMRDQILARDSIATWLEKFNLIKISTA